MAGPEKILVIKLGALGDLIQAFGPMQAIRRHHPHAHISLLTTAPYEGLARECGYFDAVEIDPRASWFDIRAWKNFRAFMERERFARVYDLQNNDRTGFYFKILKHKPEWVGAIKGASHRNASPSRTKGHAFDGHVQTLAGAGITGVRVDTLDWLKGNINSFPLKKPYVLLIPGCSPQHPEKRWPLENYGRLARILAQWGFQPVLIGAASEEAIGREIADACPEALNLVGETNLHELADLSRSAAAAIGNDTGPLHLAAVTGCPSLALFSGLSNIVKHGPKGSSVQILQKDNLADLAVEQVLEAFRPRHEPERRSGFLH